MNPEIGNLLMPHLQAIQNLPGNIPSEKKKWLYVRALRLNERTTNVEYLLLEEFRLLQMEAAVIYMRHEDITLALKSDDWIIVNQALKATWFFNGSLEIIDAVYFSVHVFPYISHYTKTRIVCTFARCIKNPSFAQTIFNALTTIYNAQTALPLLMTCDQEFIYETILEKKLILPVHIFKKIYLKYPELGIRLLKEYITYYKVYRFCRQRSWNKNTESSHKITNIILEYKCILYTLAKKRPMEFVDIVQNVIKIVKLHSIIGVLSKKCGEKFLKKAKNTVIKYPYIYMPILPSELISAKLLEMMFPGLMKYHCHRSFQTNKMLEYLKKFPEEKRLEMLFKTYKDLYQHELLDNVENVTIELLKILPIEERIKFSQQIINFPEYCTSENFYETDPICYLPVDEAIRIFETFMSSVDIKQGKLELILKMIYTCKINKDENKLYNVLSCIIDKEYIINDYITSLEALRAMQMIFKVCGVPFINERIGSLLCYMTRLLYLKYNIIPYEIVVDIIHFRLIKNMPIADMMDMLLHTKNAWNLIDFNILTHNPQYERQCLIFFIETIIKLYIYWLKIFGGFNIHFEHPILCSTLMAIYDFNERWCSSSRTRINRMTIKNYPILMEALRPIIQFKIKNTFYWKKAGYMLRKHEPDLYHYWCIPTLGNIADVTSGAALRLLKNNFQSVLNNWEEYLTDCKRYHRDKQVQRFIRATRWYKDIPIKFAEHCMKDLHGSTNEISSALIFLSLLLHSSSLTLLLLSSPLKKKITKVTNVNIYHNIHFSYVLSIMISNPPMSLKLLMEVLDNYSNIGNMVLSRVILRFPIQKIMLFTNKILTMSVMSRICWIHLICLIAPTKNQITLLNKMWRIERHSMVQVTLFEAILMLLRDNPCSEIELLLRQMTTSFSINDSNFMQVFNKFASDFVNHLYVWNFFYLWLEVIAYYGQIGYKAVFTEYYTKKCLHLFNPVVIQCTDKFNIENVLHKFLFHADAGISKAMQKYIFPHILSKDSTIRQIIINNILPSTLINLQNKFCCSARNNMYLFLTKYVVKLCKLGKYLDYDTTIRALLKILAEKSLIKQNVRLFLLLEYARIMSITIKAYCKKDVNKFIFGQELDHRMPYLVEMFSGYLVDLMAEVLLQFLKQLYNDADYLSAITCIVRDLMVSTNMHSKGMAMILLHSYDLGKIVKY